MGCWRIVGRGRFGVNVAGFRLGREEGWGGWSRVELSRLASGWVGLSWVELEGRVGERGCCTEQMGMT